MLRRQSTFVFHHASHPWSKNKILIWMVCKKKEKKNIQHKAFSHISKIKYCDAAMLHTSIYGLNCKVRLHGFAARLH
jgi:hypothetical protein